MADRRGYRQPALPTFISILAVTLATALLAHVTLALLRAGIFYSLYTSLLGKVVETTGLDLWASRAITLGLTAILWFLPWFLPWHLLLTG